MPNPIDFLKKAWGAANTPMVPQGAIQPAQDMMDTPSLDRSPMAARLGGFGAGALEGARSLTTPLNMAGMIGGPALGALKGVRGARQLASKMTPMMDIVEDIPTPQVAPSMDDVGALIGDMQRNLARVPSKRPTPVETLGEVAPEYTPVGGEGMFNMSRVDKLPSGPPLEGLYQEMMRRFGGMGR